MVAVWCAVLLFAADIDEEHCAWEITDADHFHALSWVAENGEEHIIGIVPVPDTPGIPGPLFMRPAVMQHGGLAGGVGHAAALRRCSAALQPGFPETNTLGIMLEPRTEIFLLSLSVSCTLEDVSQEMQRIQEKFHAGELHYWPRTRRQVEEAETWPPGAIPLVINIEERKYVPYALGRNYGRLRMIGAEQWDRINEEGSLTRQDIVLLEEIPINFNSRVAGAISSVPQGPLSHVNLICLQEATPNAFVAGAWDIFAPYADKLVLLEVTKNWYRIQEAEPEEAERMWASRRPSPVEVPAPDLSFRAMPSLEEIAGTRQVERFGGKGASLALFLPAIPAENRVPGFVIPFAYFRDFLVKTTYADMSFAELLELTWHDERFRTDPAYRKETLEHYQEVLQGRGWVPQELVGEIAGRIEEVFGSTAVKVRFRSSSNAEDTLLFPGAGLYWSTSACAQDSLDDDVLGPCLCDPDELEERAIHRALRKVWASLWNFNAVEQRRWHGIAEDEVCMGILVTPTFLNEGANGVALTGSPIDPNDNHYFVTVQLGEMDVVRPEPGVIPEVDLLTPPDAGEFTVDRARPSSLLEPGQFVMQDNELKELGAILQSLDQSYQPPASFLKELTRLDVEFKVTQDRRILIKQVRPYTVPGTATFMEKRIPRPYTFPARRYVNLAAGNVDVFTELQRRSMIHLREGTITLPAVHGTSQVPWIKGISAASDEASYDPVADAEMLTAIDVRSWVHGFANFTWSLSQRMESRSGESLEIRSTGLGLRVNVWESEEEAVIIRSNLRAFRDDRIVASYAPIEVASLPVYHLRLTFVEGGSLDLLFSAPTAQSTADDALLIGVQGTILSHQFFVEDPFQLAVGEGPPPTRAAYCAVVAEEGLHAVLVEFRIGQIEPSALILDSNLQPLRELTVASWSREILASPQKPCFHRGDVTGNGIVEFTDATGLLAILFNPGDEALVCPDAADANDDGTINVSDAVTILHHLYLTPFLREDCTLDETEDSLSPCSYDPWLCVGR